jgi:hypothetical protein
MAMKYQNSSGLWSNHTTFTQVLCLSLPKALTRYTKSSTEWRNGLSPGTREKEKSREARPSGAMDVPLNADVANIGFGKRA